ncbi:sulfurtransferase TusA family protein [Shewanella sp. AS1]|uniref:sulfurtransferase TusA family protein n=1 Tax=Shewanella sp. AS1 TaxID=2907626 RepID=UPI001F247009|nr:sulfurtransferase TusA family protein [Shewanella sp. AS1]MCE9678556.1 sulfurtransferase TusA family protein [Shewanella sp. AS1]
MTFIDLTAYRCPLALVKFKLALKQTENGEELQVALKDSGTRRDVCRFLAKVNPTFSELRNDEQMLILSVMKSNLS